MQAEQDEHGDSARGDQVALMLLTESRRDARTGPRGELVLLTDQDRSS